MNQSAVVDLHVTTYRERFNMSAIDRLLSHTIPVTESGCWLWISHVGKTGYGAFGMNSIVMLAHRASWILFRGPIPDGLYVCHKCDVPICINPNHLFVGTAKENMRDASNKGRIRLPIESWSSSEKHQPAKLTNDQVREIRASTEHRDILARRFGVCKETVWAARTYRTFLDVE